jgi:3-oxoacyl-[acyl-carrier-protein] synthase-3
MTPSIGIIGIGTYFPPRIQTAADIAEPSGIPEQILIDKLGIRQRHIAEHDTVTDMATFAAEKALAQADVNPTDLDLIVYHGSEYKEHLVWNSAGKIQHNLGAKNAYGFEIHAVCAAAPIAMHTVCNLMMGDPRLNYALLTVGTREHDLINLANERSRFMFNFSAGAGAMVLKRGADRNQISGAAAITDGSFAENVVLSQASEVVGAGPVGQFDIQGRFDVYDLEDMGERLGQVSLPNYVRVITEAVEQSGAALDEVKFLGLTHMKRSFYNAIHEAIGLSPECSVYPDQYGHVQSADQVITLELGLAQGKINDGDLVVLAGAGAGYTWSAVAVRWG